MNQIFLFVFWSSITTALSFKSDNIGAKPVLSHRQTVLIQRKKKKERQKYSHHFASIKQHVKFGYLQ